MKFALAFLLMLLALPAWAIEPPSAQNNGSLPDNIVASNRAGAEFSLILQSYGWVKTPSLWSLKPENLLRTKIISIAAQNVPAGVAQPFTLGADVYILPFCSASGVSAPGNPTHSCADFTNRKIQIWGLYPSMRAAPAADGGLSIHINQLLDAAFIGQ